MEGVVCGCGLVSVKVGGCGWVWVRVFWYVLYRGILISRLEFVGAGNEPGALMGAGGLSSATRGLPRFRAYRIEPRKAGVLWEAKSVLLKEGAEVRIFRFMTLPAGAKPNESGNKTRVQSARDQ